MNYAETVDYLFTKLPMFSRTGAAAYKKDLHNTLALCDFLHQPQHKFKSIHIAGTNGKGSTSHMLAAILQAAGYKTGLYTSPHLQDFRERIRINGEMISEDFVIDFVKRTQSITEAIEPSFFELTVAMAFDYFAKEQVDIAVIETGLGGRLDSTNVITPVLSVITNIGYDHVQILGDTLEAIAFEKAGIIKSEVPVVIGEYLPETKPVFERKANETDSVIYFAADLYQANLLDITPVELTVAVTSLEHQITEQFKIDLPGLYQMKNLCTVLCAEGILQQLGFTIPAVAEKKALANVRQLTGLRGRWECVHVNPTVMLDVAHNEDGIKQVLQQIGDSSQYHIVIGMVKDKDITKVLSLLPQNATYYFTQAHIPRALAADLLQAEARQFNLRGDCYSDVNQAIAAAMQQVQPQQTILVCGSVCLVGEVELPLAV